MSRLVVPQVQSVLTGHRYNAWPLQRYTVTTPGHYNGIPLQRSASPRSNVSQARMSDWPDLRCDGKPLERPGLQTF